MTKKRTTKVNLTPSPYTPTEPDWSTALNVPDTYTISNVSVSFRFETSSLKHLAAVYERALQATSNSSHPNLSQRILANAFKHCGYVMLSGEKLWASCWWYRFRNRRVHFYRANVTLTEIGHVPKELLARCWTRSLVQMRAGYNHESRMAECVVKAHNHSSRFPHRYGLDEDLVHYARLQHDYGTVERCLHDPDFLLLEFERTRNPYLEKLLEFQTAEQAETIAALGENLKYAK